MAKTGLSQVTTAQTFQTWLDRTNEIVTILGSDALTASVLGDTTTGNATLVGSFTANTVIAFDSLKTDVISPKDGSTSIGATAPLNINTSLQVAQTLTSSSGPRQNFSSGSVTWRTGFETTTDNNFIIDSGGGAVKLRLTPTGNLSVAGSITSAAGGFTGSLTGNVTGNVTGDLTGDVTGNVTGDVDGNLTGNVTGNLTGDVTGNVTGTVSSISNHDTDDLSEGSSNLYFTTARARSSFTAGTGITIVNGQISIGSIPVSLIPDLDTSKITSGIFSTSRIPYEFISGHSVTVGFSNTVGSYSDATNYVDVFPPSGRTMSSLVAFISSMREIHFNGDVNGDDSLRNAYFYLPDRIRVFVQNTEQRLKPAANWLAIWRR